MPVNKIVLSRTWILGIQIGDRSGFGRVFEATDEDGLSAAVKLVPKEPGAARELLFVDLAGVPNVVPVIDVGETEDHYVLVMPRAEESLRHALENSGGALTEEEGVAVFRDVAAALQAIEGRVVHRDIKPENVLRLDGSWCLADFGIARYAEAATAEETHKFAMTPAYAAPERWRFERASTASDIYSLGVVGYELLTGHRPFVGPTWDDYRAQHLTDSPGAIPGIRPAITSLVMECLIKSGEARPTAANLVRRLDRVFGPASPAAAALQAVNERAVLQRFEVETASAIARNDSERRDALFVVAKQSLTAIADRLREMIVENAPEAVRDPGSSADWWALRLGEATIAMDPPQPSRPAWGGFPPAFEVMASATIAVLIPRNASEYEGRSHALWYCDAQTPGAFRWFETAFMMSPVIGRQFFQRPAAMAPGEEAGKALWQGIAEYQVAVPFTPIDQGEEDAFFERWLRWFAAGAAGELVAPNRMPEEPSEGTWRR